MIPWEVSQETQNGTHVLALVMFVWSCSIRLLWGGKLKPSWPLWSPQGAWGGTSADCFLHSPVVFDALSAHVVAVSSADLFCLRCIERNAHFCVALEAAWNRITDDFHGPFASRFGSKALYCMLHVLVRTNGSRNWFRMLWGFQMVRSGRFLGMFWHAKVMLAKSCMDCKVFEDVLNEMLTISVPNLSSSAHFA